MATAVNIPDLRPLSLGELLDRTFTYYRRHFWLFVGIMALPQVFIVAFNLCTDAIQRLSVSNTEATPGGSEWLVAGPVAGLGAGMIVMFIAYTLLYSLALGATTFAISEVHLGRMPTVRGSYRSMKGRLRRMLDLIFTIALRIVGVGVVLLFGVGALGVIMIGFGSAAGGVGVAVGIVLAVLGMIAAGVFAVWLTLRYGVAIPALLLERLKAKQAIRRSILLTKGNLGRVFLILFLMSMVAGTVSALVQAPFFVGIMVFAAKGQGVPPWWLSLPMHFASGVAYAVTSPLLMIGLALLYYDTRVRKEGLDLQLIMEALDQRPAQPVEQHVESEVALEQSSVLLTILLVFITFGFYYPVWFLTRRKALNNLKSPEKLSLGVLVLVLGIWSAIFVSGFILGILSEAGSRLNIRTWEIALRPMELVAGILLLIQCFKVRRILLDHAEAVEQHGIFSSGLAWERRESFSPIATFFLGIFYLQYKINQFVRSWDHKADGIIPGPITPLA